MSKYISIAILLLAMPSIVFGSSESNKWKANPTPSKINNEAIYIPENLEDAFKELNSMLSPELIDEMKSGTEESMIGHHRGLGMWMRNNWGLWGGSELAKYFNGIGIKHPDDMSGIILDSYWRHLNGAPIKLDEQIKLYQEYWINEERDSE